MPRFKILLACICGLTALMTGGAAANPTTLATVPGQVLGFGGNRFGQLAIPADVDPNPPAVVQLPAGSGRVVQVAVGEDHTLVLTAGGKVYAFGMNDYGQLGSAVNDDNEDPNPTPALVSLPGLKGHAVQVAAGFAHSLVLTSTGQIYGFGSNQEGELGNTTNNHTTQPNPSPVLIALPGASGLPVRIAAGYEDSFAITSAGELYAWGDNPDDNLGTRSHGGAGGPNPTPTRVRLDGSAAVASVSAGEAHTLVVMRSGSLYAFGDNRFGNLGDASNNGVIAPNAPRQVMLPAGSGRVIQAAAGAASSLVLTSTGRVYAFGSNDNGQLCDGVNYGLADAATPQPQLVPVGHRRIVQLQEGYDLSLMLTSGGRLFGCGNDAQEQLGSSIPSGGNHAKPTLAPFGPGTTLDSIALGCEADHTLAVVADLQLTTDALPAGAVGRRYKATLHAHGGTHPYVWAAASLPKNLHITPEGELTGKPAKSGHYTVRVAVTDGHGIVASRSLVLAISRH